MQPVISQAVEQTWTFNLLNLGFSRRPDLNSPLNQAVATLAGIFLYRAADGEAFLFFDAGAGNNHPKHHTWIQLTPGFQNIPSRVGAALFAFSPRFMVDPLQVYLGGGFDPMNGSIKSDLYRVTLVVTPFTVNATSHLLSDRLPARFGHELVRHPAPPAGTQVDPRRARGTFEVRGGYGNRQSRGANSWTFFEATNEVQCLPSLSRVAPQAQAGVRDPVTDFSGMHPDAILD
eukprot:TRINITY_DN17047_c0_g2_i1.p1 TRINITY_DN17047_c0_g2~~TRINITY_DN17047_c0_g2_i1.p1  ORF type:complete len:232 (+),score=56.67 TRINITY_DN17047_c0_g2_i1:125-820(+)